MIKFLSQLIKNLLGIFCLILLLSLFVQVVGRYVFQFSWSPIQFLIPFLLVWLSMLGAAYGVGTQSHFVVNFFMESLGVNSRISNRLASATFILFGALLIWTSRGFLELGLLKRDPSTELPMIFTYSALPVGGLLIVIFGLERTFFPSKHQTNINQ